MARAASQGPQIDWPRTLLAKGRHALRRTHLRRRAVPQRQGWLQLIVLDSSGSMQRGARLAQAKGYAARLIEQAARAGDHVALLAFGGQGAQGVQLLLAPGPARASGVARVRPLAGGGGTPLVAALAQAERLAAQAVRRGLAGACLWLLTDGRTLESPRAPQAAQVVLVDFDDRLRPAGRCPAWAQEWGADYRRPA